MDFHNWTPGGPLPPYEPPIPRGIISDPIDSDVVFGDLELLIRRLHILYSTDIQNGSTASLQSHVLVIIFREMCWFLRIHTQSQLQSRNAVGVCERLENRVASTDANDSLFTQSDAVFWKSPGATFTPQMAVKLKQMWMEVIRNARDKFQRI